MKIKLRILLLTIFLLVSACGIPKTPEEIPVVVNTPVSKPPKNTQPPAPQTSQSQSVDDLASTSSVQPDSVAGPGETLVTYIDSENIGRIAVQITLPDLPRYGDSTGIVVEVNTFLTPANRFYTSLDATAVGLIHVSYLWPGIQDGAYSSDGSFDYGGKKSIAALKDVIQFAAGEIPNSDGFYLNELVSIQPVYENLGLYAFSHPGQAAVNVLGHHGDEISRLSYFVGRENPTQDKLTAVEVGYFDQDNRPVLNPLYSYPDDYSALGIDLEYEAIQWDPDYTESGANWTGVPYFDLNGNGMPDGSDHRLALRVPAVNGKRVYSIELTKALKQNKVFPPGSWPEDVADLNLAKSTWIYLDNPRTYPEIGLKLPDLHVMLVFARYDHVQPAADKPHIHQAYDGFSQAAGLWVRLNPDSVYVNWVSNPLGSSYLDHPANQEPVDWREIESWGYKNQAGASQLVPLAAVAEMADRTQAENWDEDLSDLLYDYPFK